VLAQDLGVDEEVKIQEILASVREEAGSDPMMTIKLSPRTFTTGKGT
jgi:hypothetical protein